MRVLVTAGYGFVGVEARISPAGGFALTGAWFSR